MFLRERATMSFTQISLTWGTWDSLATSPRYLMLIPYEWNACCSDSVSRGIIVRLSKAFTSEGSTVVFR